MKIWSLKVLRRPMWGRVSWLIPAISTKWKIKKQWRRLLHFWKKITWDKQRLAIVYGIGAFQGKDTGERQFPLSIAIIVELCRFRNQTFRSFCRKMSKCWKAAGHRYRSWIRL